MISLVKGEKEVPLLLLIVCSRRSRPSRSCVAGTERRAQGRAGFARRSEPLRASTVLAFSSLHFRRAAPAGTNNVPVGELRVSIFIVSAECLATQVPAA